MLLNRSKTYCFKIANCGFSKLVDVSCNIFARKEAAIAKLSLTIAFTCDQIGTAHFDNYLRPYRNAPTCFAFVVWRCAK